MNLKESLELVMQALDSGRPGAGNHILKSLLFAVDNGKTRNYFDLFVGQSNEDIIAKAQNIAFKQEGLLKNKQANKEGIKKS